jgi:hypothetical protein
MKLFTIGDSISQGFMSLAAARTDLSYSTIIAKKLGIPEKDYIFPNWVLGGHPINIENLLRALNIRFGSDLKGVEWLGALSTIARGFDQVEDFYERGDGRVDNPFDGDRVKFFHNIAVRGFNVVDSFDVTPNFCIERINESTKKFLNDGILALPSASFFRTGLKVLNPSLQKQFMNFTAMDWLKKHHHSEGVENLMLWLGANNALGTILSMRIKQTPNNESERPFQMSYDKREKYNLWHPEDFKADYREMLNRVDAIMRDNRGKNPNWKVYLATIPLITIAPLAKGVGEKFHISKEYKGETKDWVYFKYYTYVPLSLEIAEKHPVKLNLQQAMHIDDCILEYNKIIEELINDFNTKEPANQRYHLVDISDALIQLAFKRNGGQVKYNFPSFFDFLPHRPDTKYYHVTPDGDLEQGGLFSLDGVHPSAIGQGIIAYEFLKVLDKARGTNHADSLDWDGIFKSDSLYQKPISLMQEIYQHEDLIKLILECIKIFKD